MTANGDDNYELRCERKPANALAGSKPTAVITSRLSHFFAALREAGDLIDANFNKRRLKHND